MNEYEIVVERPDGTRKHVNIEAPNDATAVLAANIVLKAEPPGSTADILRWPAPAVH